MRQFLANTGRLLLLPIVVIVFMVLSLFIVLYYGADYIFDKIEGV